MTRISPRRMLGAIRAHLVWVPIAIACGPLWTCVHEGAHALASLAQGGAILDWQVIPGFDPEGRFRFGYVKHALVAGHEIVLLAPAFAAAGIAVAGILVLRRAPPGRATRFAFLMGVLYPMVDLSFGAVWLIAGEPSHDLTRVLGDAPAISAAILLAAIALLGAAAHPVLEHLFATGLSRVEVLLLGALTIAGATGAVLAARGPLAAVAAHVAEALVRSS